MSVKHKKFLERIKLNQIGDVYLAKREFENAAHELTEYLNLSKNIPEELQRANTQLGGCFYEYALSVIDPTKSLILTKKYVFTLFKLFVP